MKKKKTIVILGSTGMLGNAVGQYFESKPSKFKVYLSYRDNKIAYGKNKFKFDPLKDSLSKLPKCDYIINCIGIIKPNISKSPGNAITLNALLPRQLADYTENKKIRLIQITTDCVFSGKDGNYDENSEHDALDFYGKSKSLGEPDNAIVLRTSIIGEEIHNHSSLIAWAQSMKGTEVNGFTNHFWNGITTKQYAKICEKIIDNNSVKNDIYHIFSDTVNKYQLVKMISDRFDLGLKVKKHKADITIDRTMTSIKNLNKKLKIPTVEKMIKEL